MNKLIIDVRSQEEFVNDHVYGAVNMPLHELNSQNTKLQKIPKQTPIIVYCRSGNRSQIAKNIL